FLSPILGGFGTSSLWQVVMASPSPDSVVFESAVSPVSSELSSANPAISSQDTQSIFWLSASLVYSVVYLLQRIFFWVISFSTYTLPAWLFTLFSTSLTFTMNFTTLSIPLIPDSTPGGVC